MKHFSQFGEDYVLEAIFKDKHDGFFLDVGAHNGVTDSNTLMLEQMGWKGICIEPHSRYFRELKINRKAECHNVVAWDEEIDKVAFHETKPGGWSRVNGGGKHATVNITYPPSTTLNKILGGRYNNIDFVSIDVEGHEWHVLNGWTLNKYEPRIILVEDLTHNGEYDSYFKGYTPTYGWKQGKGGSNVWYTNSEEDLDKVRRLYRG